MPDLDLTDLGQTPSKNEKLAPYYQTLVQIRKQTDANAPQIAVWEKWYYAHYPAEVPCSR